MSTCYLSYARGDARAQGWVQEFGHQLGVFVRVNGLGAIGDDELSVSTSAGDGGETKASDARIFVCVLTASYRDSAACIAELEAFETGNASLPRPYVVALETVPLGLHPASLRGLRVYPFFELDGQGRAAPLAPTSTGDDDQRYWLRLNRLSLDIVQALTEIPSPGAPQREASEVTGPARSLEGFSPLNIDVDYRGNEKPVVYVAEVADELMDRRRNIVDALAERGVRVLPEDPLPADEPGLRAKARELLSACGMSIHLLSASEEQAGANACASEFIQFDMAGEVAAGSCSDPPFKRYAWVPDGADLNCAASGERRKLLRAICGLPPALALTYARKDKNYLDALEVWLKPVSKDGLIAPWLDREIPAGRDWDKEIDSRLRSADIVLLLVTIHYVASDYIREKEKPLALHLHNTRAARVIPILLEGVGENAPDILKLQGLPVNGVPVSRWERSEEAYEEISDAIRCTAKDVSTAARVRFGIGEDLHGMQSKFGAIKRAVLECFPTKSDSRRLERPLIYVAAEDSDALRSPAALELLDFCKRTGSDVLTSTEGDRSDVYANSDAVILYYGDGTRAWIRNAAIELRRRVQEKRKQRLVAAIFDGPPESKSPVADTIQFADIDVVDGRAGFCETAWAGFLSQLGVGQ